ncbi:hypothetical protein AMTR_s00037p00224340 [Amborella trichopoda]|uniref:DUF659 domain-containing protein n=1 Tax=Amborella trichopoda TaxID=13333 RepID=U5DAJ0_AMBTC|nr:hypothetical protein AMTR_s00037p00224340 [Amborella trichopoda]
MAYELSRPILDEEEEEVTKWIEEYKQSWPRTGITLMSDGWLNKVSKMEFLNFLAYSPKVTAFLSSKDVSGTKKDTNFYVRLYDQIVEEVGDKHVVQFITDNARACVSAGSKLMDKMKHLVWTPCVAHNIDLMLEEICEIKSVKETLEEARLMSRFIYNHSKILFLFREHSKKKEIIRPAITRFATDYLVVDSIRESEGALKRLFICEEWLNDCLSTSSTAFVKAKLPIAVNLPTIHADSEDAPIKPPVKGKLPIAESLPAIPADSEAAPIKPPVKGTLPIVGSIPAITAAPNSQLAHRHRFRKRQCHRNSRLIQKSNLITVTYREISRMDSRFLDRFTT